MNIVCRSLLYCRELDSSWSKRTENDTRKPFSFHFPKISPKVLQTYLQAKIDGKRKLGNVGKQAPQERLLI